MTLALHLGGPVDAMLQTMTEAEFQRWALYVKRNSLPFARLELMLGQVCMLIARTMGGAKDAKVADFIPHAIEEPDNVTHIDAMKRAFNFRPRPKLRAVA